MRHHTAAELPTGGFHYASLGSKGGYPLGYCHDHAPHSTEAEARECFAQYQRDHIRLDAPTLNWLACAACGDATKLGARIEGEGYAHAALCSEHLTLEHAITVLHLDRPAGDSWES